MWRRCVALRHGRTPTLSPSPNPSWFASSFSYSDAPSKKGKAAPLQERRMVDRFRLWAKGGEGGNGCCSLRRSRSDRHGKPDGGNGGRGGDVILECSAAVWDFSNLQHHLNAKRGGHGVSKNQIGTRGSDKVVQVPVGTVMHLVEGELPSFVENNSMRSADPWDIRDGLEDFHAKSVQNNENASHSMVKEDRRAATSYSCNNSSKEIVGKGNPKPGISPFCAKTIPSIEDGVSNDHSYGSELEDQEGDYNDDDFDYDDGEEEEEEVQYAVAELTELGQRLIIARGGEGGLGNACLRKDHKSRKEIKDNSSNMAYDDDEDESLLRTGKPGSESVLILELKSIADVGLVGMPNAGKSTLLGALSRAQPVVGNYAFTTLRPNIGNLNYEDFFSVKVADIPGLIKGAHQNRGLGHAFLRHIERTKVLAYVVDLAAALNGRKGISPWEQLRDLVLELEYHQEGLSNRPSLIVANKIDEDGAEKVCEELQRRVLDVPIFPVCAILQEGVPELKTGLRRLIDGNEAQTLDQSKIIVD